MSNGYQGLLFPERAEYAPRFPAYKVFLEHWDPLANAIRSRFEDVALRRATNCLGVYGRQGSGKTMFARRLLADFESTSQLIQQRFGCAAVSDNLWHRVCGGRNLDSGLIAQSTVMFDVMDFDNDESIDWVAQAVARRENAKDRATVFVIDNAERGNFLRCLLGVSVAEFMNLAGKPEVIEYAAQRLVALCRSQLQASLLLILSNDGGFLGAFQNAVDSQHTGLMKKFDLPEPSNTDLETVVRVNTNRLNKMSYWWCLDQAGPTEKAAVYEALCNASNYPDSFQAVNRAVKNRDLRAGRPAKRNVLNLVVLANADQVRAAQLGAIGNLLHCRWPPIPV